MGKIGQDRFQRQHRLDAFAGGENVGRLAEAHAVAEQITEGSARIGERRLGRPPWIEPGALDPGDIAVDIGDGGKQRRPALARSTLADAIVNRRVVAQGGPVEPSGDTTGAQISLGRRARKRPSGSEQPTGRFGRAARGGWHMTEIRR